MEGGGQSGMRRGGMGRGVGRDVVYLRRLFQRCQVQWCRECVSLASIHVRVPLNEGDHHRCIVLTHGLPHVSVEAYPEVLSRFACDGAFSLVSFSDGHFLAKPVSQLSRGRHSLLLSLIV